MSRKAPKTPVPKGGHKDKFVPELGQALFSNASTQEIQMEDSVEFAIRAIGECLRDKGKCDDSPCNNCGAAGQYEGKAFKMRSYCWCDGEAPDHEDGCPPNFEWRDLYVSWYKYLGRGSSQSRRLRPGEATEMLAECLKEITG